MKKLIVAASALMLTGAMASAAFAAPGISFTGDAYTRYYYYDNWFAQGSSAEVSEEASDSWRSRVRLRVKGETASGAFAATRFEIDNDRWGDGDGGNVTADYAYISVPLGCVNLTAGDWDFNSGLKGWFNDVGLEAAMLVWANETTKVHGVYAILDNDFFAADSEDRIWALVVHHDFSDTLGVKWALGLHNNDISGPVDADDDDHTAISSQLGVNAQLGPVALYGEIGYQTDGIVATDEIANAAEPNDEDGFGMFLEGTMDFDAVSATLIGGFTQDGYTFDAPVGFIMLAGDSMLSPISVIGQYDFTAGTVMEAYDTWFIGLKTSYQATEALGLGFNLAYADMEGADDASFDGTDADAFEVSASLSYALADGVSITSNIGYLSIGEGGDNGDANAFEEDDTFGGVVSLNLTF